jgi:hypothetical protein
MVEVAFPVGVYAVAALELEEADRLFVARGSGRRALAGGQGRVVVFTAVTTDLARGVREEWRVGP